MVFKYGTPVPLKTEEKDENGFTYGDPVPIAFGDYSKAEYGEPVPMADFTPRTPPKQRSIIVRRPGEAELEDLRERYAEGLTPVERQLTSTAPGGGYLGLPSPESVLERRYPGSKQRMQELEDLAWEGREESGWGEVFANTLRNTLPRMRRQIVGGFRGGDPVTMRDLQMNADVEVGAPGSGQGNIAQSIQNQRIAKEWGFEEGSEKVPPGVNPVEAFAEWLQSEEGSAEIAAEAASTPVAMFAQDVWDEATGELKENAIEVRPQSAKYYAAGILDAGINMGPAMAATVITKNPNVGAAMMGGQVYGDVYGSMLDRGYTPDQAQAAALYSAAAETLTERIPLGVLTSGKFSGLKRILAGAGAEGIQEPLTEALQMGYDVGILDEEIGLGEAMWRLIDAGIIGFGVGAGMGAGVEAIDQLTTPAAKEALSEEQEVQDAVAGADVRAREEEQLTELETAVRDLDDVVNNAASNLDNDQLQALQADGLVKLRENGTVQVLPKARRRFNAEQRRLDRLRIEQEGKRRGMEEEQARIAAAAAEVQAEPADADAEAAGPSRAQIKAGNYKKGHLSLHGLDISIENPRGSVRRGTSREGKPWQSDLEHHYGYIKRTEAKDGDQIDVFIGPDPATTQVYVVNQKKDPSKPLTDENFDEHKVMVGFDTEEEARAGYLANYEPGWRGMGSIVPMSMERFRTWLEGDGTKQIVGPRGVVFHAEEQRGIPGFYSGLAQAAQSLKQEKGTPDQMLGAMKKAGGVKQEELEWTGLPEFLRAKKSVTRQEITDFIDSQGVQLEETVLSETSERAKAQKAVEDAESELVNYLRRQKGLTQSAAQDYALEAARGQLSDTQQLAQNDTMKFLSAELERTYRERAEVAEDPEGEPLFTEYTLPGGENYREVLLRLPIVSTVDALGFRIERKKRGPGIDWAKVTDATGVVRQEGSVNSEFTDEEAIRALVKSAQRTFGFQGGHFDQPNVLANLRLNDRTTAGGKKVLFIEEVQSDWHQKGRREGYRIAEPTVEDAKEFFKITDESWAEMSNDARESYLDEMTSDDAYIRRQVKMQVPDAPFKGNAWAELSLKRVLRLAAEGDYDVVAWTTGDQQANRYDLSKQIDSIDWAKTGDDKYLIYADKDGQTVLQRDNLSGAELAKLVGKDIADRIVERGQTSDGGKLKGIDLQVGGEGMKSFYDKTLRNLMGRTVKRLDKGATIGVITLPEAGTVHAVDITDKMQDAVLGRGLPLFQVGQQRASGVSVESLRAVVEEATELYPGAPNITIADTESSLPKFQREALQQAGVQGQIGGMFDPDTGTVYLIASNIRSRKQALEIFLHESVGHYGLRSILGADYDTMMDTISKAYPTQVKDAGKRNGLDVMKMDERRIAAEEFIAYRAQLVLNNEKAPAKPASLLQQLVELLRIAIDRLRGLRFSDTDVLRLIRKARIFVATPNGKGRGALRNREPPVIFSGLWRALNERRVPTSGSAMQYRDELRAQIRAGNVSSEDAVPMLAWVANQPGLIDKYELMEQVREQGNRIAFHVEQYDGRRRAIETGDLYEHFEIPEGSRTSQAWNYLVFKAQDKFIDLLNVQRAIEQQTGRQLDEQIDAYLAEELFHGKVKSRIDRFDKDYIRPLIESIEGSDYTWDEVEWYLYARHAPEANARLYEINRSGAIARQRDNAKKKAQDKLDRRMTRIGAARAKKRNKAQADFATKEQVIESEYRSQMRRSRPTQAARRRQIEEAKTRKLDRARALRDKRIDEAEAQYRLVRDDYQLTYQAEIEEADTRFREREEERVGEDPGLLALSGMSDQEAEWAMEVLRDKGDIADMERIADLVDKMTFRNREILVSEGLETQDTIDAWEAAYDHYVPLKGWKDGPMNTTFFPKKGKGYDTGGKLQQRRLGRRTLAANILANIVAQHQSAVIMGEKAKVGRTLLQMVEKHPNENLWTANQVEMKRRLDPKTGLVTTGVDPTYRLKDNVLRVKVDGRDYHITFNENNAAAMRIASSMKNLSAEQINLFFQGLLGLNRVLSAVNTSFNPEFVVSNLTRDLQTAMINLNATDANNMKMAILRDVFKAHRGIRRFMELPSFKNKEQADYWRTQFEEYRDLGGQVGWLDNYRDVQDLEASLYRQMHDRTAGMISWATLRKMGKYIELENQAIENAVRLSSFVHAKQAGLSPRRAASLAKNLTVNFNRKGDIGTSMNALYLFYNASIQGMAIMWKAAKSPAVRRVMYGIVAFAASLEIMNRMIAGDDDDGENRYDKIPTWVKERNMIVMLPERYQPKDPKTFEDYYITIPLPYGYNMLHVMGQKIGGIFDYVGIGNKREWQPMEDATEILSAALGSFNPIGTGPTPLQTVIPTALTPLVQVSENVAWHGGPVMPPQNPWDPAPEPESQQYFRSARKHTVALAEFLNQLGGGSKARPADLEFLDISPETIELWEDFLTGGAGRFVSNTVELGIMAKDDEVDVRRVPFVRRFVGKTDERAVSERFYENVEAIAYAVQEIKVAGEQIGLATTQDERRTAIRDRQQVVSQYEADAALEPTLKLIQNQLKALNAQRKAVENARRPDEWKEEKTKAIELKKTQLMNSFNRKYNQILRKRAEQQEETAMNPVFSGKDRMAAVQQLNKAGYSATAGLIGSLPTSPGANFVRNLDA